MLKKTISALMLCAICIATPHILKAQAVPIFDRGQYSAKSDTLPYRILFPENFDPDKKYPLIVFLHGSGEKGNDNEAQLKNGTSVFLKADFRQQYPAIVVVPQCPVGSSGTDVIIQKDSAGKMKFDFPTDAKPTKAMQALMGF